MKAIPKIDEQEIPSQYHSMIKKLTNGTPNCHVPLLVRVVMENYNIHKTLID